MDHFDPPEGFFDDERPVDDFFDTLGGDRTAPQKVADWADLAVQGRLPEDPTLSAKPVSPAAQKVDEEEKLPRNKQGSFSSSSDARLQRLERAFPTWSTEQIFETLPEPDYLVEHLDICSGPPTLVAGEGFSGKTVFCQDLALAVAAGTKAWAKHHVKHGRVAHLDFEQGQYLTRQRYQRLSRAMNIAPEDLNGRLQLVTSPRVYLDDPSAERLLLEFCVEIDLCLIDSLRAATPNTEENSSEARKALDTLTRVSERTGTAFVVIHHSRKPNANNGGGPKFAIRGSSAIYEACSSVLVLEAEKGSPTLVHHEKARMRGTTAPEFGFRICDIPKDGDPRWGLTVVADEELAETRQLVSEGALNDVRRVLKLRPAKNKTALASMIRRRKAEVFAAVTQLEADGEIEIRGTELHLVS